MPLQVLLTWDYYLQWFYTYLTLAMLFYKIYRFSFTPRLFVLELTALLLLQSTQFLRIFVGSKGNKLEKSAVIFWFMILFIFTMAGNAYFTMLQTYVLLIEQLVGLLSLVLSFVEFIFALFAMLTFKALQ